MFSPIPIALRIASWMLLLGFGLAQGSEAAGRTDSHTDGQSRHRGTWQECDADMVYDQRDGL